jgi:hypothetical protein
MRVVLVGRDMAPSQAFAKLVEEKANQPLEDVQISAFLGNGKPVEASLYDIEKAVQDADIVLLGMSSSPDLAKEEIAAGEAALKYNVPFGLYADTYIIHRAWFEELEKKANFVFVPTQKLAKKASPYYGGDIVVSGNPMWEEFLPTVSREDVRHQLSVHEEEIMVVCPGGKVQAINRLLLEAVIQAINRENLRAHLWEIVYSVHPGDEDFRKNPAVYDDLVKASDRRLSIVTKEVMPTSTLVVGADLLIESMSTEGIRAAHQRIPVIDYMTEPALQRLEKMSGSRKWDLCEEGAALAIQEDVESLAVAMKSLLDPEGFGFMRALQVENYPDLPPKGTALRNMLATLRKKAGVRL